jgi:hypothetical protein
MVWKGNSKLPFWAVGFVIFFLLNWCSFDLPTRTLPCPKRVEERMAYFFFVKGEPASVSNVVTQTQWESSSISLASPFWDLRKGRFQKCPREVICHRRD